MGDLAVEYGFYGSEWDSSDPITYEEVRETGLVKQTEQTKNSSTKLLFIFRRRECVADGLYQRGK